MTYLRKEYGLSYMPRATEQTESLLSATGRMARQCLATVTKARPERRFIILTLCADFIARMTFTGDMGTLYDYLTLPKFAYSKEDYGFLLATRYVSLSYETNSIYEIRQSCQGIATMFLYTTLSKRGIVREKTLAIAGGALFVICCLMMFATWYVENAEIMIWMSNVLMGPGAFGIIYIKSSASSLVDPHEQGRMFSLLASAEVLSQSLSVFVFGNILKATVMTAPSFSYVALALVLFNNLVLYQ